MASPHRTNATSRTSPTNTAQNANSTSNNSRVGLPHRKTLLRTAANGRSTPLAPRWTLFVMSIDPTPAYRPIAFVLELDHDPLAPTIEARGSQIPSQIDLCWQTATNRSYQLLFSSTLTTNQCALYQLTKKLSSHRSNPCRLPMAIRRLSYFVSKLRASSISPCSKALA